MQLTVTRGPLLKAISHGQSVVERKSTLSMLGHVLLQAKNNQLTLTTTNMDMTLVERIPAEVTHDGQATVPVHLLYDIVRKLPDDGPIALTFLFKTAQLLLQAGRAQFHLSSLPIEDFPCLALEDLPHEFSLPSKTLKELIDKTKFAMANEDTRFYLNGIHWHTLLQGEQIMLRAVATDYHRLACLEIKLPSLPSTTLPPIIIGRKTVTEVAKLLDETQDQVTIKLSPRQIQFHFASAVLFSRLLDGLFPDYEMAIPRQNKYIFTVKTKDFFTAIDRVATLALSNPSVIQLQVTGSTLKVSATGFEAGSGEEEINIHYNAPNPLQLDFNARYLLDVAPHIHDETTIVSLADANTAALIQGADSQQATYVLMPINE